MEGLKPTRPQHIAGNRNPPAISDPMPSTEPRIAIRADSPPAVPPVVIPGPQGFSVRPKMLLWVSDALYMLVIGHSVGGELVY